MDTITIKIRRKSHKALKMAYIKEMNRRKKIMPFVQFCDEVLIEGLKRKGYKQFSRPK